MASGREEVLICGVAHWQKAQLRSVEEQRRSAEQQAVKAANEAKAWRREGGQHENGRVEGFLLGAESVKAGDGEGGEAAVAATAV